jgi:hypothetical protein
VTGTGERPFDEIMASERSPRLARRQPQMWLVPVPVMPSVAHGIAVTSINIQNLPERPDPRSLMLAIMMAGRTSP